jgi:hypothetical protein
MDNKQEKSGCEKVCKRLAKHLKEIGFLRTKPSFFTRVCPYWIGFGYLHKFTFGPYFRVHFGIRILSDQNQTISLNGPDSDSIRSILYHFPVSLFLDQRKYDFKYRESLESIEKCAQDIFIFWKKVGLPWFERWQDSNKLIKSKKSPLSQKEKELLRMLIDNTNLLGISDITKKKLGLS